MINPSSSSRARAPLQSISREYYTSEPKLPWVHGLFVWVSIFALVKPDSLVYIGLGWLDSVAVLFDTALLVGLLLFVLLSPTKLHAPILVLLLFWILVAISTAFGSAEFDQYLKMAGPSIAMCLLFEIYLQRYPRFFLKSVVIVLLVLYSINLLTIIVYFPEGMYDTANVSGDNYFMGFDNGMIINLLPLCGFVSCIAYSNRGKLRGRLFWFTLTITVVSLVYVQAITGIVQIIIFLVLLFWSSHDYGPRILKPILLIILFFLIALGLTVFRVQHLFAGALEDVGKDVTLTGRDGLWDAALSLVAERPWVGHGVSSQAIVGTNDHFYAHPHSLLLDTLVKGGIVLLAVFILLLITFVIEFYRQRNVNVRSIVLVCLFAMLIGETVTSYQFKPLFWALFVLIGYADSFSWTGVKLSKNPALGTS
ncbi:O-antigen ligase family protein [Pseudoclavibacter sp. CFCC 11306]|uniref:O-antigen ligase family protein n=1 Tax=Pseudoclavibacter sp. CFCC 11306 TaxID=1564493 RepID=UPI0013011F7A|nr:O-antigen ligase family protein [Pseudoclavibacter sp. CFCC 11306]KAB1658879.1 O-antigen ligase family protein [Pseudoclavibacter sp. CFCC 11306]